MQAEELDAGSRRGWGGAFAAALVLHVLVLALLTAPRWMGQVGAGDGSTETVSANVIAPEEEAAAPAATPGGGGDAESAATDAAAAARYQQAARERLGRDWTGRELGVAEGLACRVRVGVRADGAVMTVRIVESSGSTPFDRSVLAAVRNASPLPPPPSAVLRDGLHEFELLVDPRG